MLTEGLVTTAASQKGALPTRNLYDIHCPMLGGPGYKINYLSSSCRARQLNKTCEVKDCERRVNLVRPGLVQKSSNGVEQEQRTEVIPVGKKPVRECKECGRTMAIVGRGLCGACLFRFRKDGTIDERYPSQRPRKAVKVEEPTKKDGMRQAELDGVKAVEKSSDAAEAPPKRFDSILGPIGDDKVISIEIEFMPRDRELFERLTKWATEQRRELEDQIMFALDNLVDEKVQRGEL